MSRFAVGLCAHLYASVRVYKTHFIHVHQPQIRYIFFRDCSAYFSSHIVYFDFFLLLFSQFKCFAEEDHDIDFPHLLHSVNATQVDIEFVKLTSKPSSPSTLPHIEHPRIAAEFLLMANESNQKSFTVSTRKTLDDEHTPGIFELIDIISPNSLMAAKGLYSQKTEKKRL